MLHESFSVAIDLDYEKAIYGSFHADVTSVPIHDISSVSSGSPSVSFKPEINNESRLIMFSLLCYQTENSIKN